MRAVLWDYWWISCFWSLPLGISKQYAETQKNQNCHSSWFTTVLYPYFNEHKKQTRTKLVIDWFFTISYELIFIYCSYYFLSFKMNLFKTRRILNFEWFNNLNNYLLINWNEYCFHCWYKENQWFQRTEILKQIFPLFVWYS